MGRNPIKWRRHLNPTLSVFWNIKQQNKQMNRQHTSGCKAYFVHGPVGEPGSAQKYFAFVDYIWEKRGTRNQQSVQTSSVFFFLKIRFHDGYIESPIPYLLATDRRILPLTSLSTKRFKSEH